MRVTGLETLLTLFATFQKSRQTALQSHFRQVTTNAFFVSFHKFSLKQCTNNVQNLTTYALPSATFKKFDQNKFRCFKQNFGDYFNEFTKNQNISGKQKNGGATPSIPKDCKNKISLIAKDVMLSAFYLRSQYFWHIQTKSQMLFGCKFVIYINFFGNIYKSGYSGAPTEKKLGGLFCL